MNFFYQNIGFLFCCLIKIWPFFMYHNMGSHIYLVLTKNITLFFFFYQNMVFLFISYQNVAFLFFFYQNMAFLSYFFIKIWACFHFLSKCGPAFHCLSKYCVLVLFLLNMALLFFLSFIFSSFLYHNIVSNFLFFFYQNMTFLFL